MKKKIRHDSKYIQVFEPTINFKDKVSVLGALNKKYISGTSPIIKKFEENLEEKFNVKKAVAVTNGSVALDLAFQLLDLEEGDEVILPSFTIISCLSAVIRSKAKPVFCDVDSQSWNMTLQNVKNVVTKNTKAVLMVHTYGLTAEADEIKKFCENNDILIIEDAAEAHGQSINNILCGTFGNISTLSFYANKHITTGEGGALLINDEKYYEKALRMRNLDFDSSRNFQHDNFYWNYRMSGLQAALGISQITYLEKTIQKKINQASIYNKLFSTYKEIQIPLLENKGSINHYWVYGILLNNKSRDKLYDYLNHNGIQTRKFFWPLHLQNALPEKYRTQKNLPVSERLGKDGLYIPIGAHISEKKQNFIVEKIINFLSIEN